MRDKEQLNTRTPSGETLITEEPCSWAAPHGIDYVFPLFGVYVIAFSELKYVDRGRTQSLSTIHIVRSGTIVDTYPVQLLLWVTAIQGRSGEGDGRAFGRIQKEHLQRASPSPSFLHWQFRPNILP